MRFFEAALKAVADPTRTRILKLLEDRELCVCQIQAVLRLAPSTVSKHLSILKSAGLVDDRRDGRWMHYSLSDAGLNPHAKDVLRLLRRSLGEDATIEADLVRLKEVTRMPLAELCSLIPADRAAAAAPRRGHRHA